MNARSCHWEKLQIAKFGEENVPRRKTLCWLYGWQILFNKDSLCVCVCVCGISCMEWRDVSWTACSAGVCATCRRLPGRMSQLICHVTPQHALCFAPSNIQIADHPENRPPQVWGSRGYRYNDYSLLGYDAVYYATSNLFHTFLRNFHTGTGISGHFSTTLTEVFPCFPSVVRQMPGYNSQRRGTARTSQVFPCNCFFPCSCYVCSVLCILCTVCV
jgi:hypothetical protein